MRASSREHVSHVAILTPSTSLHLGRLSRVLLYSSSIHLAMQEDSLMTRDDDDIQLCLVIVKILRSNKKTINNIGRDRAIVCALAKAKHLPIHSSDRI